MGLFTSVVIVLLVVIVVVEIWIVRKIFKHELALKHQDSRLTEHFKILSEIKKKL